MVNKYKKTKNGFEKKHAKGTKTFLKNKKRKSMSIILIEIRTFLKNKNKKLLGI